MTIRLVVAVVVALVLGAVAADAQVIPFQYRVTRRAVNPPNAQPMAQFTFPKSAMQCGIPRGALLGIGLRINDPANDALDCEFLPPAADPFWQPLTPGIAFEATIAGGTSDGRYGPDSLPFAMGTPGAPNGFRLQQGVEGVSLVGSVQLRFPFPVNGDLIDVATFYPDGLGAAFPIHIGAWTLAAGSYSVQPGDRAALSIWRPAP